MDPRITLLKDAFNHQFGASIDFPVYQGRTQYGHGLNIPVFQGRSQYGAGFGDVLRGIWRFFRPVAIKGAQTLLKAGSEAIKDGATVKEVLSSTLKPTLGAVLGATAEQVANHLTTDKPTAAPPPGPPSEQPSGSLVGTQKGSGKRKTLSVYKRLKQNKTKRYNKYTASERPIVYNF